MQIIPNARTRLHELMDDYMGTDYWKLKTFYELLQYLDTDTIEEFTKHLRRIDYLPAVEETGDDIDNTDTESYEVE